MSGNPVMPGQSQKARRTARGAYHGRRAQYAIREPFPRASHPVQGDRLAVYAPAPTSHASPDAATASHGGRVRKTRGIAITCQAPFQP